MQKLKLFILSLSVLAISATAQAYNFARDLEFGSEGNDVAELQQMLISAGHLEMPADATPGYFGKQTETAVAKWQIANGITPISGIFGPRSRAVADSAILYVQEAQLSTASSTISNGLNANQVSLIVSRFASARILPQAIASKVLSGLSNLSNSESLSLIDTLRVKRILSRSDYSSLRDQLTEDLVPTATLTINGVADLTVNPGQTYTYAWSSTNAKEVSATWETVTGAANKCGGESGRLTYINTASGSMNGKVPIVTGNAGCVWEITVEVESADGTMASDTAILRVPTSAAAATPLATLRINNSTSDTVNPGTPYVYSWSSTNGVSASGSWRTTAGDTAKCGVSGTMAGMNTLVGSKSNNTPVTVNQYGCVWAIDYVVKNLDNVAATSTVTLRAPAVPTTVTPGIPAPTASLRINDTSSDTVNPGELYVYSWSSRNGSTASGTWRTTAGDTAKCGVSGTMAGMNTLNGSMNGVTRITENHAGCVWTIDYVVKNLNNVAATSTATLRVPAVTAPVIPEPTATLRINNSSDLTVGIGEAYTYSWSSTNGVSASGTWRTTAGDTAKCGVSGTMAGMNTLVGSVNGTTQITANHAGCVWEVKYEVKNRNGVSATSIANLRAIN